MPDEVAELLKVRQGGNYLDGTLGGGGHSELILEASAPDGTVIGIDRDMDAVVAAQERLRRFGGRFIAVHGSFGEMASIARIHGDGLFDGILLDLGVSSHQLDTPERGFSFRFDGPLDMRMDKDNGVSAATVVNSMPVREIERIIKEYGEERWARKIAQRIVKVREDKPIETTMELAGLVEMEIPRKFHEERIHPATRTFQALRIVVNSEMEQLEKALKDGIALLRTGGRMAVIAFHSLEDRMVKHAFRDASGTCRCPRHLPLCVCGLTPSIRVITSRPRVASAEEVAKNPRARSAKLRAVEKLP